MRQNPEDDIVLFDDGDHLHPPAAARTVRATRQGGGVVWPVIPRRDGRTVEQPNAFDARGQKGLALLCSHQQLRKSSSVATRGISWVIGISF